MTCTAANRYRPNNILQAEMRQKKLAEIEAREAAGLGPAEPSAEEVSL